MLSDIEIFAISRCLESDPSASVEEEVRRLSRVKVHKREFTGVGAYVWFERPDGFMEHSLLKSWDWNFSHRRLEWGGVFILYVIGSSELMLEMVTHGGGWPQDTLVSELSSL